MEGSRRATTTTTLRRRAAAVTVALAATAALWFGLSRSDDPDSARPTEAAEGLPAPIADLVAGLSPEELVDQVLLLGFDGTDASAPFFDEVRTRQLGGVLVEAPNWPDAGSGSALVAALREAGGQGGRIPPLIVTSQEGGPYRALADLPPEQTELEIGNSASPAVAERWARQTCAALAGAGFDLNLSPVADVATLDSPIADRSFSDDPAIAAQLTAAAVRGCREAGLASAALHFPGLGAASQDTSQGPATVSLDPASLASRDLQAFGAAFAERVPAVVLSLAFYAAYDPVTPGALSPQVATGLLRDQLGFEGLAISDDLGSGAVRSGDPVAKAAVQALAAGADLIQIGSPADQVGAREAIVEAVAEGALPRERLAEAAGRVLELKGRRGLLDSQ
jgi:beta-N-acetylhexosaminidase